MTAGRTFTNFAEQDPEARSLVAALEHLKNDINGYREQMRRLGAHLAESAIPLLGSDLREKEVCVVCTVEDADFLARGVIERLEMHNATTRMICLWNERIKSHGISISPVLRTYEENYNKDETIFIVVKSIISGACVVKTNLTKVVTSANPKQIFVMAPVVLKDAEKRLSREFPEEIARKFVFIYFAADSMKSADGEEVIPGIGGSVYELLGLGDAKAKNKYIPEIVRERRKKVFQELRSI